VNGFFAGFRPSNRPSHPPSNQTISPPFSFFIPPSSAVTALWRAKANGNRPVRCVDMACNDNGRPLPIWHPSPHCGPFRRPATLRPLRHCASPFSPRRFGFSLSRRIPKAFLAVTFPFFVEPVPAFPPPQTFPPGVSKAIPVSVYTTSRPSRVHTTATSKTGSLRRIHFQRFPFGLFSRCWYENHSPTLEARKFVTRPKLRVLPLSFFSRGAPP